eukprot:scaffold3153_cov149-Skeletonema_marinoi.AAC.4
MKDAVLFLISCLRYSVLSIIQLYCKTQMSILPATMGQHHDNAMGKMVRPWTSNSCCIIFPEEALDGMDKEETREGCEPALQVFCKIQLSDRSHAIALKSSDLPEDRRGKQEARPNAKNASLQDFRG